MVYYTQTAEAKEKRKKKKKHLNAVQGKKYIVNARDQ